MDVTVLGGGIAAGLVLLGFLKNALTDKPTIEPDHGNVHGGASIAATLREALQAGLTRKPGGFFITAVRQGLLRFGAETGMLVFGGPRTGKGVGIVIPTLLDRDTHTPESLLVYDPAAENIHVTGPYLKESGYRIVYSNVAGLFDATLRAQFGAPVRMNPLGAIDINHPLAEVDIGETAAVLVPLKESDKSPHFAGTAQQLTAGIATWLCETEGPKATWPKVAELIHQSSWAMNELFAAMKTSRFATVRATAALWHLEVDDKGTMKNLTQGAADVLSTARRELNFLLSGGIAEMFSAQDFNFATMKHTRTVFFLVMAKSESDKLKKCTYLLLRMAKQALLTPGGLTTLFLIDEMCAALPPAGAALIRDDAALVAKFRIRICGICQSWAQFQVWCGGKKPDADAVRSMFGACVYIGANDNTSLDHIQVECGKYTVFQPGTNPLHEAGIDGNSGTMAVPLFQREEIEGMITNGQMIVKLMGSGKVCLLPRANYQLIEALRTRAAANPYHLNDETKEAS